MKNTTKTPIERAGIVFPPLKTVEVDVGEYALFQIKAATKLKIQKTEKPAEPPAVEEQVVPPDNNEFACTLCSYVGKSARGLAAHMRQAHPEV